jgi:hypothetical protein
MCSEGLCTINVDLRKVRAQESSVSEYKLRKRRPVDLEPSWGHTSARSTYVATHILHGGRCWGHHTARMNLAGNSGGRMQLAIFCHEKTWRQWDIHGKTQTKAKTTKRWSTVKDERAVIQEDNRIRQVTNVKLAPVWPAPFEGTQSCDVTQQGSTCVLA